MSKKQSTAYPSVNNGNNKLLVELYPINEGEPTEFNEISIKGIDSYNEAELIINREYAEILISKLREILDRNPDIK